MYRVKIKPLHPHINGGQEQVIDFNTPDEAREFFKKKCEELNCSMGYWVNRATSEDYQITIELFEPHEPFCTHSNQTTNAPRTNA